MSYGGIYRKLVPKIVAMDEDGASPSRIAQELSQESEVVIGDCRYRISASNVSYILRRAKPESWKVWTPERQAMELREERK